LRIPWSSPIIARVRARELMGIVAFVVAGVGLFLRAIYASGQSAWPSIMWGLMCVMG
jgi:hypothetical protein